MSYGEISNPSDHTTNDQWLFTSSFINGKFNRENANKIFNKDEELKKKISWEELDDILKGCEKTTGFFLCTRFVLLLIISFAITAIALLIVAFYLTSKKKYDKTNVIYTYVIAITIGVFCNLLLFLIYLLISNIYEKQLNLYLGQRRIVTLYEARRLYWRAHGTRITLNIIYKRKCDSTCGNYVFTKAQKNKSNFLSQVEMKNPLLQT